MLALIQEGRRLTPPYRAEVSGPAARGLPDRPVELDGAFWTGRVFVIETLPGGEVLESSIDAASFNADTLFREFTEPGTFHFVFDNGICRQEFDVEVRPA